ncbi:CPBP family intramembrane metalloprotease [Corynebacterium sp. P3-F1]|uniref:CPBP family intramembrane glutamic endopeptidase n=1 Tax=Corynebacterium sp. P3-F1 TaxID=3059080 RepID=UPI00265D572C|nr:CPBP family intramembrane glutamic endopeptidase [Corynebacterium sp. P3-F1]WKK61895.1 CPBP family intramembrane metalloprotease [Corynebacterium sp. P3-F1]
MSAYHLLGRTYRLPADSAQDFSRVSTGTFPRPAWWRPLLELVLAIGLIMALTAGATGLFYLFEKIAQPSVSAFENFTFADRPYLAVVLFIGWVAALPASFIAARLTGRDPRAIWSIERRFRWKYFGLALIPALIFLGAEGIFAIATSDRSGATVGLLNFGALAVIIAMAPLQSLSEELFFRGSLVQIVGQWFSPAWVAYLLPFLFFLSGHHYGWMGMVNVGVFALCAIFLTYKTGGIEAAAAVHAVGNTFAYAPDAFGVNGVDLNAVSTVDLLISVAATVAATAFAYLLIKRRTLTSAS